jgi:hypothetical protein
MVEPTSKHVWNYMKSDILCFFVYELVIIIQIKKLTQTTLPGTIRNFSTYTISFKDFFALIPGDLNQNLSSKPSFQAY